MSCTCSRPSPCDNLQVAFDLRSGSQASHSPAHRPTLFPLLRQATPFFRRNSCYAHTRHLVPYANTMPVIVILWQVVGQGCVCSLQYVRTYHISSQLSFRVVCARNVVAAVLKGFKIENSSKLPGKKSPQLSCFRRSRAHVAGANCCS